MVGRGRFVVAWGASIRRGSSRAPQARAMDSGRAKPVPDQRVHGAAGRRARPPLPGRILASGHCSRCRFSWFWTPTTRAASSLWQGAAGRVGRQKPPVRVVILRRVAPSGMAGEVCGGGADDGTARVDDSAVVRGDVRLGRRVLIGRGCVIDGDVRIGDDTRIDDHCIVRGRVRIGADNWVYPFCAIGTGPQHKDYMEDSRADPADQACGEVVVGAHNVIREGTTVHLPAISRRTSIGSHCYILAYSHVAHDCTVGDDVTMANMATLGGHSRVDSHANLGFHVSVHPHCRIGTCSMVAMMMPVVKDVPPYALVNRQVFSRVNDLGMQRAGMSAGEIDDVRGAYARLGRPAAVGNRFADEIRAFIADSKRGCYLPA